VRFVRILSASATDRAGASADSSQQTRADVRRNGGKVEANAASQSQGRAEAGQQLDLDAGTQINNGRCFRQASLIYRCLRAVIVVFIIAILSGAVCAAD
jgi:hypothetical protein